MSEKESRRTFFKTTTGGAAIIAVGMSGNCSSAGQSDRRELDQGPSRIVDQESVESEIKKRADFYLSQRYLVVDYYRIRRKLAYPLPVKDLSLPEVEVPSITGYPWATWMTWELEERINSLGWAAEWFGDKKAQEAASADLEALASWPAYRQYDSPDLSSGHAGRILWTAFAKWTWLDQSLRKKLIAGCRRHCTEVFPGSNSAYGQLTSTADIMALERPYRKLHNIALIGTIAAALTGSCAEQPEVAALNRWIQTVFGANLDFRKDGFTEGVGYDGYVLDFIADWLSILPEEQRLPLLGHESLPRFLEESYMLSAPGAAERVAEIGDVEPKEMPFHISAQAKLYAFRPDPICAWHLRRWNQAWVRSAGLGALHSIVEEFEGGRAPADGVSNAHYSVVLRNGWSRDGLAAVVSCCSSPMGHLQYDNGTLVVGKAGQWLITDPGYQQYMRDQEREFTLGPSAHNYPVINGQKQNRKSPQLKTLKSISKNLHKATVDLTACYPEKVQAKAILRTIWISGADLVVVADQVDVPVIESLQYHWHGHADASWASQAGWVLIHTDEADLWLTSPQFTLSGANIVRLPASRGQLTVSVESKSPEKVVWWLFVLGENPVPFQLSGDGQSLELEGQTFKI